MKWSPSSKLGIAIIKRDRCTCLYCGRDLSLTPKDVTIDHIHPRSKGGDLTDPGNLVLACKSCNSSKCARSLCHWHTDYEIEHRRGNRPYALRSWGEIKRELRLRLNRKCKN